MTSGIFTTTQQVADLHRLYFSGMLPKRACAKRLNMSSDWAKKWLKEKNYKRLTGTELISF